MRLLTRREPAAFAAPRNRARLFRLISLLLQYPDAELLAARDELGRAAAALPESATRDALVAFTAWYAECEPTRLARAYVETFDLRRRSSLYLTYYLHGDTRRRGMALLTLKQRYRVAGLVPPEGELPDYLPVVCEFAALAGPSTGEAPLRQHRKGLELIRTALREAGSSYSLVLDALCAELPDLPAAERAAVAELALTGPPAEDVGLAPYGPPAGNFGPSPYGPPAEHVGLAPCGPPLNETEVRP
ncbi:nitrate reductase molybdenum cofactor assembly chaperone [Nonomuraea rhodomycinica]|uniref:Nitrate reductase molybdenum cofactor assembly chaperone n=1 Tax=Nonomuraea rhodomycinica TaxID=1712872 RepID=A0A7Y6MA36_9ACTN|nr:nitrate reductase molybdenum cofactor assembly chaperone [Nonomuraea rhodomycinica]NUW39425.1 nitrate reductase molybdenum cofactor assembly chaperone [Nonomuraea rhodomycinica]